MRSMSTTTLTYALAADSPASPPRPSTVALGTDIFATQTPSAQTALEHITGRLVQMALLRLLVEQAIAQTSATPQPHPLSHRVLLELDDAHPDAIPVRPDARARLLEALSDLGVAPLAREWFATAAQTCGALETGQDLASLATAADPAQPAEAETGARETGVRETGVGAPDRAALVRAGSSVLDLIGSLTSLGAHLDGALVQAAGDLTRRTGRILLADRKASSPEELSATARTRWRSRARNTAAAEITAFTGIRPGEAADLVNLATTPPEVGRTATDAMRDGVAPWDLVRPYFRASSELPHEDAAHIASVLFGSDPDSVAEERLDKDGDLKDAPWNHQEFRKALDREVQAVKSRDPEAAREARERARQKRDIRAVAHSDGTGQVVINGTAAQAVAVNDRMERAARRARAGGDERTLGQLRSDLAMSLLLHSGLNLPDLPDDADLVTTQHTDQMKQVLLALPAAQLQVIVPYSALVHAPNDALPGMDAIAQLAAHLAGVAPSSPSALAGVVPGSLSASGRSTTQPDDNSSPPEGPPDDPGTSATDAIRQSIAEILSGGGDVEGVRALAAAGGLPLHQHQPLSHLPVGEALGAMAYFLSADGIRDLALQPGTTLSRLLVDPADGRCVERSIESYAPDALMRAQIHAADVSCRAPGCVQHATYSQLDHVLEWPQGPTAEPNLETAHHGHHHLKTCRAWHAVMDPTDRSVTWTTLLGRIYRTRVHDYRQYTRLFSDALARVEARTKAVLDDPSASDVARRHARADAIDQAVIEALAWRDPRQPLAAGEEQAGAEGYQAWSTTLLSHTTPDGQRRTGPAPDVLEAERRRQEDSRKEDSRKEDRGTG